MPASGSVEPEASRVTVAPTSTDWSGPADATGARLACVTVIVTWSLSVSWPSETVSVNVYVPGTVGTNARLAAGPVRVTSGPVPPERVQE